MTRCLLNSCVLLLLAVGSLQARLIPPLSLDDGQLETKGAAGLLAAPRVDDNSAGNYRLPNTTAPESYNVDLWTNVHTGNTQFNGTVIINLRVLLDTSEIKLHYRQTSNFVASIISRDSATATAIPLTVTLEQQREFLVLTATNGATFAAETNWTLTIKYNGTHRSDNGGFYISSYTGDDGKQHFLATTQFESTDARHAFPCYDEPARRANFTITIHHDPSYTAISNMPVNESTSSSGITVFQTTPKMSTYLVAFIVSDFESTTGELNGLRQRVFSRKGKQDQQEWALWSGLVVESSLAGYFGVPFALPKLDQAGIPDFSAGAMENWGLATYREQYMWWNKQNSTVNLKTSIANIIGHEYAHMWFGDLVSVEWWTYLWLKEGFATLFSYESNDIAFPEWDTYQIFHVNDYNSALLNDAATYAVPMTHYVQTPNEILGRYNAFSYAKPASVLYMFKNAWTDKVFRTGLNKYLTKNKYTSCEEWDLFAAFQESANELGFTLPTSVDNIFSSWSHQAGYPLLTVTRNYEAGTFTITQKRYLANATDGNAATWYVPINFATASKPDYRNTKASHYLLNVTETVISDSQIASDDWLLLNIQNAFYYRTLYDTQNYGLISAVLKSQPWKIHHRNRAQLLYDTYIFVTTDRLSHSILLEMLGYLEHEDQYAPWSTANTILTSYDRYLRGDDFYYLFQMFVQRLIDPIFDKIGVNEIPGEHYLNNYLRVVLVSLACQLGSVDCHRQSARKLSEYLYNGTAIEATLRNQAYCAGLRATSNEVYKRVESDLLASTDGTDRNLFMLSLGCSESTTQLLEFLNLSLDTTNSLSYSERTSLLNSAYSRSEIGLTASLEFLETSWEAYAKLSSTASKPLDLALRGMASYVVSEKQKIRLNALVEVVNSTAPEYLADSLSTVIDSRIEANFVWLNTNRDPVLNWIADSFRENSSPTLTSSFFTIVSSALALLLFKLF
ncbi:aminopeptidase N [Drosophila gunungcola]|uniref:aminopeptidase N n=1 Tax=Drosophila gunungcola TaxID=103775 RepID=UPI0022E09CA4|nr:aminopeptidase N [Drosophila gunungcola]